MKGWWFVSLCFVELNPCSRRKRAASKRAFTGRRISARSVTKRRDDGKETQLEPANRESLRHSRLVIRSLAVMLTRMKSRPVALSSALALLAALLSGCRPTATSNSGPPTEAVAAVNRGVSQMGQYQYEAAVQSFEQAAKSMPDNADVQVNLAIALFNRGKRELGDLDRPVQMLDAVLQKEPGNLRARYFLGIIHTHVGKAELAVPCFEAVTRQQTNDGVAWYLLGLARQRIGQPADKEFLRAVELRPNLYSAWYKLGQSALAAGDEAKGNAYLDKFKQLRESPAGESIEIPQYGQMGDLAMARPVVAPAPTSKGAAFAVANPTDLFAGEGQPANAALKLSGAAFGDFNGDQKPDIILFPPAPPRQATLLLSQSAGGWKDATARSGLNSLTNATGAAVGDFDNDGTNDLLVVCDGGNHLLRGKGDGTFANVTSTAGISATGAGVFIDADHDGDLDLVVYGVEGVRLWNNNGDGTFTNLTAKAGLAAVKAPVAAVLAGDFDGDRDVDLVLLRVDGGATVLFNQLLGGFAPTNLDALNIRGELGGALADFNGDGFLDLLALGGSTTQPTLQLFNGNGRGNFAPGITLPNSLASSVSVNSARGFRVADLDLDGDLDVLVFGDGLQMLLNDGNGIFLSSILPASGQNPNGLADVEFADLNGDLVPDLIMVENKPGFRAAVLMGVLPKDSSAVAVAPSGIRSRDGRTRSPASGYGVSLTARAGLREAKLYHTGLNGGPNQSCVPAVLGLGGAREADYVQLVWPDGVMQIETNLAAGAVHMITELQRKISSCPVLFTWNGERFEFVTDFAGVGGLGYYVAPGVSAPPQVLEHVKIEPAMLRAKDGAYELRVTEPMEETAYVDRLELLAIDHATNQAVFPDERLAISGPPPTHELLVVEKPIFPMKAQALECGDLSPLSRVATRRDASGDKSPEGESADKSAHSKIPPLDDCTENLLRVDRIYAYTPPLDRRYIGFCAPHTLELDFSDRLADLAATNRVFLFIHGFIEYPYSQTIFAASQSRVGWEPIRIEQQQADGSWKTIVPDAGAFGGMARMMTVDLTGRLAGPRVRLRLTTNMELFYDQLFLAQVAPTNSVTVQTVPLQEAVLRRSGFAREVSPDGREPLIYDYQQSEATAPFHVLRGAYTRFGDVKELLQSFDDRYVLVGPGEEIALKFDATKFPVPPGKTRSFILVSHAYCKDMDLYTATPQTVEPLPFRGMSQYPYPATERFPQTPAHQAWQHDYNTRTVR